MIYAYVPENGEDNKEKCFIKLFRTDGKEAASIPFGSFPGDPRSLDLNADKSLAAAALGTELLLFDTTTKKLKIRLTPDSKYKPRVRLAVCAPENGRYFISGEQEEGSIYKQVWTTYLIDETGKVLKDYGRGIEVRKMIVTQDGKNLVVQTPAGISVWNVETGRSVNFAKTADKLVAIAKDGLVVTRDKTNKIVFYTLSGSAVKEKKIADFELVEDLLQGIAPRNKLFLMDTCESGEIDEDVRNTYFAAAASRGLAARTTRAVTIVGKGPDKPEKRAYLFQKDRYIYNDLARRSGAVVFSSCRGGEFGYESDKIGNGYFTKAIIGALKGEAAKDGVVSVEALRTYVEGRVAKDTQDLQHPTVDRDNLYQKFAFPAVK